MRRLLVILLAVQLAACATVTTRVLEMNPAVHYPPAQNVEVLFDPPARPFVQIAAFEGEGDFGVSEIEVLQQLRERAAKLGADALVRTASEQLYQPPTTVYDPIYDPFFYPRRYYPYAPFGPPYAGYRVIGGGYYYAVKAMAIKYQPGANPVTPPSAPAATPAPAVR